MRISEPVVSRFSSAAWACSGFRERVALADADRDFAAPDRAEKVARHFLMPRAIGHESNQGRPGGDQRALLRQEANVEGFDRPRRRTEAHEHAEGLEAIERSREGRLADAVIDHMAFPALGDLAHALGEILLAVEDRMFRARLFGELGLLRRADGADYGRPQRLAPLAKNEPDASGRGMDQDRVALLHAIGLAQEILRRQALEHHRRAGLVGNRTRQLEEEFRVDVALLGVGAGRTGVGDAIAGLEPFHGRPDLHDFARALAARRERQARRRIEAGALIDVDKVDPDRVLAQPDLALPRRRRRFDLLVLQGLRAAGLMNANGAHGLPLFSALRSLFDIFVPPRRAGQARGRRRVSP